MYVHACGFNMYVHVCGLHACGFNIHACGFMYVHACGLYACGFNMYIHAVTLTCMYVHSCSFSANVYMHVDDTSIHTFTWIPGHSDIGSLFIDTWPFRH